MSLRAFAGRVLTPLARRTPFSPNALTGMALLFSLAAAVTLAQAARFPRAFLIAIVLSMIGGFLDILDGVVARERHLTSRWGDFLDHFCDRVSDLAWMVGWILGAEIHPALGLIALTAIMLNGYSGTQVEATFQSREYETTGRAEYFLAVIGLPLLAWFAPPPLQTGARSLSWLDLITALIAAGSFFGTFQRLLKARRLARSMNDAA